MTEWYVIDRRSGEIVNCITVDGSAMPSLDHSARFEHGESG